MPIRPASRLRAAATLLLAVAAATSAAFAQTRPAPPPVRDVTDTYFGTAVPDPYRYFEDVKNPAVLLTAGVNDPRVDVWDPAKMAARLQAASASGKPVLLRIEFDAGHGVGSTKKQGYEERADTLAFLLWQAGVEGFQP